MKRRLSIILIIICKLGLLCDSVISTFEGVCERWFGAEVLAIMAQDLDS